MRPNLNVVTLGVSDLRRSLRFYKDGLGWPTSAKGSDPIAFFELNGTVLALFDRKSLAEDAGVGSEGGGFSGLTLAQNARSEKEVDETIELVRGLGAKIVKEPQKAAWGGYSGYFADPDGHLWEVAYNPFWKIDEKGTVSLE